MDVWIPVMTMSNSTEMDLSQNATMANCSRRIQDLNLTVHEVFGLTVPSQKLSLPNWEERGTAYFFFFYFMLVAFGLLFLALGCGCILLLWKRHSTQRFKVRTFIAIDIALMILAFSRLLFFCLDPWVQTGYFTCRGCIVFARLVAALAFPSLTASYTLVFVTLWLSAQIQIGRSCVQNLKVLIPLCCVHYVVAIAFEIFGSASTLSAATVFVLIGCETFFTVWGFLVCFMFLFAGIRLLRTVKKSVRSSSVVCRDSPCMTRAELIKKSSFQHLRSAARQKSNIRLRKQIRDRHQRALRKVTIITYVTAGLGMLYSCLNIVGLVLVCLKLLKGCIGFIGENTDKRLQPAVWLILRYFSFTLEITLAVLLTYAITDYAPVVSFLKSCCGLKKVGTEEEEDKVVPNIAAAESSGSETSTEMNKVSSLRNGTSSPIQLSNGRGSILKKQLSTGSEGTLERSLSDAEKAPLEKKIKFATPFTPTSPSPLTVTISAT